MLAIAAYSFSVPSETFIRQHVREIAPGRTVLLCWDRRGTETMGCPVLAGLAPWTAPRHFGERVANYMRLRWRRYIDPALVGADERRVRAFLEAHGVSALLAEYGPNGCLLRLACKRAGVPLFVHFHGFDATKLARVREHRRHYRTLFRDAAGIIAPSRFLADRLHMLGCPEAKLHVSPNGIDPSQFRASSREEGRFVAVGRLVEKKAPHLTIRAFASVRREWPNATLDMIGDGPLRELCEREIANHCLQKAVRLHGIKSAEEVKEFLSKAAIFVQHSVTATDGDMESFGVSLLEAMASSVPVVATVHNGFPETVADGETGLLVAEHDVAGMSEAMLTLLRDPEHAAAMGRAGRARVETCFTHTQSAARLRQIMEFES